MNRALTYVFTHGITPQDHTELVACVIFFVTPLLGRKRVCANFQSKITFFRTSLLFLLKDLFDSYNPGA